MLILGRVVIKEFLKQFPIICLPSLPNESSRPNERVKKSTLIILLSFFIIVVVAHIRSILEFRSTILWNNSFDSDALSSAMIIIAARLKEMKRWYTKKKKKSRVLCANNNNYNLLTGVITIHPGNYYFCSSVFEKEKRNNFI